MKKILLLALSLLMASAAYAVSYPPEVQEPTYLKAEEVMTAGAKVHMFHSGTPDVRNAIRIGDLLDVYFEYPPDLGTAGKRTGKVKVLRNIGEYYFEGYVVEGFVQPGSLALKGTTACIITTQLNEK